MKKIVLSLLPLLLIGCANNIVPSSETESFTEEISTTNSPALNEFKRTRDQLIGTNIHALSQTKGTPTNINKGRLGNFYTWKEYQSAHDFFYQNFTETICVDTFEVDQNDKITNWMSQDCYY